MTEVGVVIVTYESGDEIGPCLDAAAKSGAQIVVVDNASCDKTAAEVRRRGIQLIANSENRGFAAAVNQGVLALGTRLILLLNPDAVMATDFSALCACCEERGVAGAGGKLVGSDGAAQVGFMVRRFPTPVSLAFEALLINRLWRNNPVNWNYRCLDLDFSQELEVEQPAGAFLMFRREVWDRLGGFEESYYPLWFEDVDFCYRAVRLGWRFRYTPRAVANHTGGHSIPKIRLEIRQFYWYRSLLKYAVRQFPPWAARVVCLAVVAGSVLRMLISSVLERGRSPVGTYINVIRLAGRSFFTGRVA